MIWPDGVNRRIVFPYGRLATTKPRNRSRPAAGEDVMLTVKMVAEKLNVAESTVYALIQGGRLPALRIGVGRGTIRIREEDLEAYIGRCAEVATPISGLRHIKMSSPDRR